MKITASEIFTQTDPPHEVFPIPGYHNVELISLGVTVSRKENGLVGLLFSLRNLRSLEKGITKTTVILTNTTLDQDIPISDTEDQFVDLDPRYSYTLTITKESSVVQTNYDCKRVITCLFTPDEQTPPAS